STTSGPSPAVALDHRQQHRTSSLTPPTSAASAHDGWGRHLSASERGIIPTPNHFLAFVTAANFQCVFSLRTGAQLYGRPFSRSRRRLETHHRAGVVTMCSHRNHRQH